MKINLKLSVALLLTAVLPRFAFADIVGPYTADANTLVLLHFDAAAGGTVAANQGLLGGNFYTVNNATAVAAPPTVTTMLGAAGYVNGATNFNNCLTNPTAGYLAGFDYNNNGQFDADVSGSSLSADRLNMSVLNIGNGGNTPFTLEALIQPTTITTGNQEILCTDSSAGNRGFQFRITSGGALQFSFIYGSQAVSGTIPTTGPDAFVAGNWYHVAVSYDGTRATLYWTKLDPSNGAAHILASAILNLPAADGTVQGPLIVGNENRNNSGEQFLGSMDEVCISSVARGAGEMQLYSSKVTITQNPVSQNVDYNQPVRFTVNGSSSVPRHELPLGYQWRFNSSSTPGAADAIAGATNSSYYVTNVASFNAGYYDCVVTNSLGYAATSSPALLVVGAANFLANRYSFTTDTSDSVSGQTGTNFGNATVSNGKLVLDGTTGTYMQLPGGLFNGTNATALTVEFWASYGSNPNNVYPFAFGYTNFVLGSGIVGVNYAIYNARSTGGQTVSASPADPGFAQSATAAGNFDGQTAHIACVFDPPNQTLAIYTNGILAVVSTNFSVNISSLNDQLSYIGRSLFESDPYLNASIDEIRIFKGALSSISIKQSQDQGPDTLLADGPAKFVLEPTNTRIPVGLPVTFTAAAVGYLPITYQWFTNGTPIPNATNASYSFATTLADNNTLFKVNATNTIGVTTYVVASSNAVLTVFQPPTLVWVGGSGNWDYTTANNWSNTVSLANETFAEYDKALFDGRGVSQPNVNLTQVIHPSEVTVNSSSAYMFTSYSANGTLTGEGSLTKQGSGKLTLDVTNTMTGSTFIQAGTLQLGNYDTVGSLSSGPVTNNGVLSFARSDSISVGNLIHGTGSLSVEQGTVVLQGSNDFSGATFINGGILNLQNGAGLGNAAGGTTIASGAQVYMTVNANVAEPLTLSGTGDGNGAMRKGGAGYTAWTGTITMTGDASFGVDGSATLDLSNVVSGAYALSAVGSGTLAFSTNNTFSGGTTLNGPIIDLNAVGALGTGPVTINGAGRFVIKDGLNITNSFLAYQVNPGVATGFFMVNDNTNGTVTTVSGPIDFEATASSGGHFVGPISSGYLNVASPITMPISEALSVRDGRVRFSKAGSSYGQIQVRANTTSIGVNNGVSTSAVLDLAGNGTAFLDLNGFNQTLAGMQNIVTPANAGLGFVTNSSATPSTLTLDLGTGNYSSGSSLAGNLSLVLQSGFQAFTGTNAFTGNTTVNGGILELAAPSLAAGSTVTVANGAQLQLDFTVTNQVAGLVLGGVSQAPGVYNSTTSSSYFYGSGSLKVVPGPSGPAYLTNSVSGSTLSLAWPPGQNWRLEMQTNSLSKGLGTNWVDVTPGSANTTNITVNPSQPAVFYRLIYP